VVANAAAISEAQHDKSSGKKRGRKRLLLSSAELKKKHISSLGGLKLNTTEEKKLTSCKRNKISGLDLLHKTTMDSITGK
jgi:hypothetical protein